MIPIQYRYLVRQVPKAGTTDTKHWYNEYQRLVHRIPSIGTTNTKRWYGAYQALIQSHQRVTEKGGARSETTRYGFPLTTGVAGALSTTCNRGRIGLLQLAAVRRVRTEVRQQTDDNQRVGGVRMLVMERVRVGYQHPVDVVDVGKRRYACLVRHEERQQA